MPAAEGKEYDADGDFALGCRHWRGDGVPVDGEEAATCWARAARAGHVGAVLELAANDRKACGWAMPPKELVVLLKRATPLDRDAEAVLNHLVLCSDDRGWDEKAEAFEALKTLADEGSADALFFVAECFRFGRGVPRDGDKALELLHEAVDRGNVHALSALGYRLSTGFGAPRDAARGIALFREAAERGDVVAHYNLGVNYESGVGGVLPQNKREASRFFKKAAEWGDIHAQFSYARSIEGGWGDENDLDKAAFWFKKSADGSRDR